MLSTPAPRLPGGLRATATAKALQDTRSTTEGWVMLTKKQWALLAAKVLRTFVGLVFVLCMTMALMFAYSFVEMLTTW